MTKEEEILGNMFMDWLNTYIKISENEKGLK